MYKIPLIITKYLSFVEKYYEEQKSNRLLFFRGHSDASWTLLPSVFRSHYMERLNERQLILDYKQVAVPRMEYRDKVENILVTMQHYGIPTRLLDWSLSPLVALYFACQRQKDKDGNQTSGIIYAINPWTAYDRLISKIELHPELMDILKESRMLLAQKWNYHLIKEHIRKKYSYELEDEALRIPIPFVGRYMTNRIPSQQGCFLLWGDGDCQGYARNQHCTLPEFQEYAASMNSIMIHAEEKEECLKWLNRMGINNYEIYPDAFGMQKDIFETGSIFNLRK